MLARLSRLRLARFIRKEMTTKVKQTSKHVSQFQNMKKKGMKFSIIFVLASKEGDTRKHLGVTGSFHNLELSEILHKSFHCATMVLQERETVFRAEHPTKPDYTCRHLEALEGRGWRNPVKTLWWDYVLEFIFVPTGLPWSEHWKYKISVKSSVLKN